MAREYNLIRRTTGPSSGIDYRAELNDEQFAAVTAPPVIVSTICGTGSSGCVQLLAQDLAAGTDGTSYQTTDPSVDLNSALVSIVFDACRTAPEP